MIFVAQTAGKIFADSQARPCHKTRRLKATPNAGYPMPSTAIWIGLGIRQARRWETEMLEAATNPDAVLDAVEQRKTNDA
jgi:hypothetical protein